MTHRPLVIGGPTATGKTSLAVELALGLGGELVNADSRQVMRRLRVGTATPTAEQLRGVRCHLLDLTEPGISLAAPDWRRRALAVLDDLAARGVPAIVVGGTAHHIRALCEGWTFAGPRPDLRERSALTAAARTAEGLAALAVEVVARDPAGAAATDLANPRRVVRAIETLRAGMSLAEVRRREGAIEADVVVLDASPAARRAALEGRIAAMFDTGALFDEVVAELARGTPPGQLENAGIGYREAVAVLRGDLEPDVARSRTEVATRRYAKAQRTAFRSIDAVLRLTRAVGDDAGSLAERVLAATATR